MGVNGSASACSSAPQDNREAVKFRRFDPAQLPELMTWFPDAQQCRTWGGAEFRFPFTPESFRADSRIDDIASWSLAGDEGALAAFGQCYVRLERCHFGRLAVSPKMRGGGLGTRLIRELTAWGLKEFGDRELSLFVKLNNERAHQLYLRLGFHEAPYPGEPSPFMANSRYMIATQLRQDP
jgi:ribosomal protein S18 acetylase RimI-like enzyme